MGMAEEASLKAGTTVPTAHIVKKMYIVFCVGALDVVLKERWLRLLLGHFGSIIHYFKGKVLTWWMALPLHRKIFPDHLLSKIRNTTQLSARKGSRQHIRTAVQQFEIVTGAKHNQFIACWELNVVIGGVQARHLQRYLNPGTTKKSPFLLLLCDGTLPPSLIAVCRQAGKEDSYIKVDLTGWDGGPEVAQHLDKNKYFPSQCHAMSPLLDSWKVNVCTFSNVTSREMHDKLLQKEGADVRDAVRSAEAMVQLVNEPFNDILEARGESLSCEEMCCADRYFDIVHLHMESCASHFLFQNPWVTL